MSNDSKISEAKSVQREPGRGQRIFSVKTTQLILWFFSILEALIALRIVLKLIGANPENLVVALIYGLTSLFLIPFVGLVRSPTTDGMVLEISSIFAITIYALIGVAFEKLIRVISSRPRKPVTKAAETTTSDHTIP